MAVRKVIPSAGFAPGSERSVTDATDRRLAYRELIVTGEGFELVITVSTAQSDQPADATFLVAGAYHVSFVCSGPPRQCPAIAALRRLAFDPRLVALL